MSLSVHDVLLLPGLQAMRLRAGRAGEHHTVRWPYVAENASITEWVRGGELVFVTGINQPRDEANLRQLVQEAHARGCAGLVVLTGPLFIHGIPDSVLAEADRLAVPLIEQPYDLPMVVVTEAIGSALVQAQWLGSSRQQLIEQLLDASLVDATVLAHRAERLGIDLHRPRQVLVLQLDGTAALFHAQAPDAAEARLQAFRQTVLHELQQRLQALGHALPVVTQGDQWVALLPLSAHDAPDRHRGEVEQALLMLNAGDGPLRVYAGLSAVCPGAADLSRGLGQARQALVAARSFPERLGLCCFEELGVLELLVAIRDRSLLDRFLQATLGPLLHHEAGGAPVLVQTLEAWMQTNGHLVAAAQRLGVHRNTLNYRMQQIESLTGLDLDHAPHRLNIAVALMIWRLSSHPSSQPQTV